MYSNHGDIQGQQWYPGVRLGHECTNKDSFGQRPPLHHELVNSNCITFLWNWSRRFFNVTSNSQPPGDLQFQIGDQFCSRMQKHPFKQEHRVFARASDALSFSYFLTLLHYSRYFYDCYCMVKYKFRSVLTVYLIVNFIFSQNPVKFCITTLF